MKNKILALVLGLVYIILKLPTETINDSLSNTMGYTIGGLLGGILIPFFISLFILRKQKGQKDYGAKMAILTFLLAIILSFIKSIPYFIQGYNQAMPQ